MFWLNSGVILAIESFWFHIPNHLLCLMVLLPHCMNTLCHCVIYGKRSNFYGSGKDKRKVSGMNAQGDGGVRH